MQKLIHSLSSTLLVMILVVLTGLDTNAAGNATQSVTNTQAATVTPKSSSSLARQNPRNPARNSRGKFRVKFGDVTSEFGLLLKAARVDEVLQAGVEFISQQVGLPSDVDVWIADCDVANAYYSREDGSIIICNQLMQEKFSQFQSQGLSTEAALESTILATMFTLYHEAGHMLIDRLKLPIVGKEEDAADSFATYILLRADTSAEKEYSSKIIFAAATWFLINSQTPTEKDYFVEHSLHQQRLYRLICALSTVAPDTYENMLKLMEIPESSIRECQQSSRDNSIAWGKLLRRYLY